MTRLYVKIPITSAHKDHVLETTVTIGQYVDKWVVQKVYEEQHH